MMALPRSARFKALVQFDIYSLRQCHDQINLNNLINSPKIKSNHSTPNSIHSSISVFSKNGETERKKFLLDGVTVSSIISEFSTSNKMRGAHTAQLNKSLEPVSATIDHVLVFNGEVINTSAYTVNVAGNLNKVRNNDTLTTSPNSIVDHAFVISRVNNRTPSGISYGTLNIKGGNPNDKAWAEFIPQMNYELFETPKVMDQLDKILMHTFKDYKNVTLAEIKGKNFLSTPRCEIFDINLPNSLVPYVCIYVDDVTVTCNSVTYILSKDKNDEYQKPIVLPEASEWVDVLLRDLNSKEKDGERRKFLLDKGYLLLNYWHNVQTDQTVLFDGISLSSIYDEWYKASTMKVSIGKMLKDAKTIHPTLSVVSLQEMPKDQVATESIIEDIKQNLLSIGATINVFMMDTSSGSTRGAIVVFN